MSSPESANRSRFHPVATAIYGLLWIAAVGLGQGDPAGGDSVLRLYEPETSAARVIDRDLLLGVATSTPNRDSRDAEPETHPKPTGLLALLLLPGLDPMLAQAIEIETDLLERRSESAADIDRLRVLARLAMLRSLAGSDPEPPLSHPLPEALATDLAALFPRDGFPKEGSASVLADPGGLLAAAMRIDPEGWLELEVARRRALATARAEHAAAIEARQEESATTQLARVCALVGGQAVLVLAGILAAFRLSTRDRISPGIGATWDLTTGLGVWIRADFWHRLYYLALSQWDAVAAPAQGLPSFLYEWGGLISLLPLAWLVHRHLLAPAPDLDAFGIGGRRPPARRVAQVLAVAIAADLAGILPLTALGESLGDPSHWSEGIDEVLLWGSSGQLFSTGVDYIVWTPLFEEVAFRGVLFLSLRPRLGFAGAAAVSALSSAPSTSIPCRGGWR